MAVLQTLKTKIVRRFVTSIGARRACPYRPGELIEKGAIGVVEGKRVALGNAKFLGELKTSTGSLAAAAEELRQDGATAIFVAVDGRAAGVLAIADPVKATTPAALKKLTDAGIWVVMLAPGCDDDVAAVRPEVRSY
jgi:cation transport ATPase